MGNLKELRELHLCDISIFTNDIIKSFSHSCLKFKYIYFVRCDVNDSTLETLSSNFAKLGILYVENTNNITTHGIMQILTKCNELYLLQVKDAFNVNKGEIDEYLTCDKNINFIYL